MKNPNTKFLIGVFLFVMFVCSTVVANAGAWLTTDKGVKVWTAKVQGGQNFSWSGGADANGFATGEGILQSFQDGIPTEKYSGSMSGGKKNGYGINLSADGTIFEGSYIASQRSGEGTNVWPDGNHYKGGWVEDKQSGRGVFTWANGDQYNGDYDKGQRSGKGVMVWVNGDQYRGSFLNGKPNGRGAYIWADGKRYEGEWLDGRPSGKVNLPIVLDILPN